MFCESYRETLSEAAVKGKGLAREAEAHLEACAACRAAFAEEQVLLGLIDNGLRSVANAEVPASLVPRVREQVAAVPAAAAWRVPALAFATAILAIVGIGLSLSRGTWRTFQPAKGTLGVPAASSTVSGRSREVAPQTAPQRERPTVSKGNVLAHGAAAHAEPEVIVSPEEEIGLQRYAAFLRTTERASATAAVVENDAVLEIKPLEIAEMEMKELSIEPLDGGGD